MKQYKVRKFVSEAKKLNLTDHILSETENSTAGELKKLKLLSNILLDMSDKKITRLVNDNELYEVNENV